MITKKIGMSQVYADDGTVTPVTILQAAPVTVVQVKTKERDGYSAVQVGYGTAKEKNVSKSVQGHVKDLGLFASLQEFRVENEDHSYEKGQKIAVDVFEVGDMVDVSGTTIGRGFAGVVKRHGFAGSPATHGHKDQHRMPGSIGAQEPQRVFKGTRMGGQMGNVRKTVKNLKVIAIDLEKQQIFVKGAVPGSMGGMIRISTAKNA